MVHENQLQAAKVELPDKESIRNLAHRILGKPVRNTYDFSNYFRGILPHIQQADIAVCNLETTVAGGEPSGYPKFNTPDSIADAIAQAGFSCVAAANNHSFDSGTSGIIRTRKMLERRHLAVVGTRKNPSEKAYQIFSVQDVKVALLNFTYETAGRDGQRTLNNRLMDPEANALLNSFCFETLEEDLEAVRQEILSARSDGAQIVLIYYHWGNEYERHSNVLQKYIAWRTAHMGVDAIIGSHAHVLQELGHITVTWDGKERNIPVFYGLGNYIWGAGPRYDRETVLNTILAKLDIAYDEQTGDAEVIPSYVPLYIGQKDCQFETIDLQALSAPEQEAFKERFGVETSVLTEQIRQTLENQTHPQPVHLHFDHILTIPEGSRMAIPEGYLPTRQYKSYHSEDAAVVSVLQNGFLIGNTPGYTGIIAVDTNDEETVFLVRVVPGKPGKFPILVNEFNKIRDIYIPPDRVSGEEYNLPEGRRLCEPAAQAWNAMLLDARKDGVHLRIVHGFRSKRDQLALTYRYVQLFGQAAARQRYHLSGSTEHHLGTALDVMQGKFGDIETTKDDAFRWMMENAWRYGFLVRNPREKISYSIYLHMRYYPDLELVRKLHEQDLTLEQYLTCYK